MQDAQPVQRTLIEASKVQGAAVYDPHGERLGAIDEVMIEKLSGRAAYAIISSGGFPWFGERLLSDPLGQAEI